MKTICIKTNNAESIDYLLNSLENIEQSHICFSLNTFKNYKNIIIHYTGTEVDDFIANICDILSSLVIAFYEDIMLKRLILSNYFYFDSQEREAVFNICLDALSEDANNFAERQKLLLDNFYNYLTENNKLVLDGVINFRLNDYSNFLSNILDDAVNQFIVEREYWEFISLLKVYISSESSSLKCVHLIYTSETCVLLDENKEIIDMQEDLFKAKYLSDISFSSNDYALNTLLNILPKKIYVHLSQNEIDEFINTLMLIFENRVEICEQSTSSY